MSIASELTRLQNAKNAITSAIAEKGVTVPSGTKLDGMAALIGQIEAGGGEVKLETWSGSVRSSNDPIVYYTNENGEAESGSSFGTGSSWFRMNAAANTYILVEGFQLSSPTSFNCEIVGCYEFAAIGGYAILVKPTANDFRVQE